MNNPRALRSLTTPALALLASLALGPASARGVEFDRVVIDADFPSAYQVEVADVNGDGKPDVVAVGGDTCAWYENPSWVKRVVSGPKETPGIISSATLDLDGDGKAEIAIAYDFAMNEPTRGKLVLAVQGKNASDPWAFRPVAAIGSIHRLRWGDVLGSRGATPRDVVLDKKPDLVVAPIFGPSARPPAFQEEAAHLLAFDTGPNPTSGEWTRRVLGEAPVLHAIALVDLGGQLNPHILGASNLGVTVFGRDIIDGNEIFSRHPLATGAAGEAPKRGASEVHLGRLKGGRRFLATVEPWHGTDVAVYLAEPGQALKFGTRQVIDTTLKEGHALWVADVDGDGDDEVFAGFRGPGTSVLMYDRNASGGWDRTVVDPAIAAQDLRGGDLDGDGKPDVVAVGGSTHNVVWYRPRAPRAARP